MVGNLPKAPGPREAGPCRPHRGGTVYNGPRRLVVVSPGLCNQSWAPLCKDEGPLSCLWPGSLKASDPAWISPRPMPDLLSVK